MVKRNDTKPGGKKPKSSEPRRRVTVGRLISGVANHPILLGLGIIATLLAVTEPAFNVVEGLFAPDAPEAPLVTVEEEILDIPDGSALIEVSIELPYRASVDLEIFLDGERMKRVEGRANRPLAKTPTKSHYTVIKRLWHKEIKPVLFEAKGFVFTADNEKHKLRVDQTIPWIFMEGELAENSISVDLVIEASRKGAQAQWRQGLG